MSDLFANLAASDPPERVPEPVPAAAQGGAVDDARALSDEQRAAVEHTGGPLIVLAGPGTGKTRVITARVAHLVREHGVEADTVLAVTFTNKAAGELRARMEGLLPQRDIARLRAGTMHAFGMRLLRRFGDLIGLPPEMEILDSAQERRLARDLIRGHGLFRASIGRGIDAAIERGLAVSRELTSLGITPEDALRRAEEAERGLAPEDGVDVAAARAELAMFAEAARFSGLLDDACLERGTPRFDDLIRWPILVLEKSSVARDIVRQQCRHTVVDEFQDLNATQIRLLALLAPPESVGGRAPDVCVVGDDDQSIYAFRGADERAFERFATVWGGAKTVRLTTNYRSGEAVIDASNAVIGRAVYRFAPDKMGVPGPGNPKASSVEMVRMNKDTDSPRLIAGMLRASLDADPGLDLSKVAAIARSNSDLRQIGAALDAEGIAYVSSVDDASREDPGVRLLLSWCELLVDPTRSWAARAVLTRAPFRCDPAALGAIEQRYRAARSRAEGDEGAADPGAFLAWAAADSGGEGTLGEMLGLAAGVERSLGGAIAGLSADEALMRVIRATGAAHAEDLPRRERAARVRSLVGLVRFARERIGRIGEPRDLRALLAYIEDLPEREKTFAQRPEEIVEPAGPGEEAAAPGVRLLTAHASKGLEFDTVYIARVCPGWGFPKTQGADDPVVPELVTGPDPHGRDAKARLLDEERRVFFVALTRAERRAVLLGKPPKKGGASVHYTLELLGEPGVAMVEHEADEVMPGDGGGAHADELDALDRDGIDGDRRAAVLHMARRSARREAAGALDAIERSQDVGASGEALARAADRLAMVTHVERTGEIPDWARERGVYEDAARLVDRLHSEPDTGAGTYGVAMSSPLRLSYTAINAYLRCPRCFYVHELLGLEQPESAALAVGKAVHGALESFTRAWSEADSEGRATPGWEELEKLTRRWFFASWPGSSEVDHAELGRAIAQSRLYWEQLHDPGAHILEMEKDFEIPFVVDGVTHPIRGKIDRIDLMEATGGRRLIDYKTGHPGKDLLEPKPTDLQLGIYSMALAHMDGVDDPAMIDWSDGSVGEYWLLASGERGSVALGSLKLDKVRAKIEGAVRGMLGGAFERGSSCSGDCDFLDDVGVPGL